MSNDAAQLNAEIKRAKLTKWDGEGPIPEDAEDYPEKYEQVAEVVDALTGKTLYRRD